MATKKTAKAGPKARPKAKKAGGAAGAAKRRAAAKSASGPGGPGARVEIWMGSKSDWKAMEAAASVLDELGVECKARVVSAHRTPERHRAWVAQAEAAGTQVFICGAGMAAHLAGVTAAATARPVLGVPLEGGLLGLDALLATAQMPGGVPVGTLGLGRHGAKNAGLLAAAILALSDPALARRLDRFRRAQSEAVPETPL